jgi:hypothetical protein
MPDYCAMIKAGGLRACGTPFALHLMLPLRFGSAAELDCGFWFVCGGGEGDIWEQGCSIR